MEGVKEIMTQKVFTKYLPAQGGLKETITVQRGICGPFAYSFYLAIYPNSSDMNELGDMQKY